MKVPALVVILGAALCALPGAPSFASVEAELEGSAPDVARSRRDGIRSTALRATSGSQNDTLYVGYTPGHEGPNNYWSIYSGRGAGFHRPPAQGGMWDWETPVHGDSLQGWWPRRLVYTAYNPEFANPDWNRPWWAIDVGNQANYVINQGAGNKRTFGVVGVWHRDPGSAGGGSVAWSPLGGSHSAWMGLRRHGDNSVIDPITLNSFNENVLTYNGYNSSSPSGNDKGFPGYGSQMDQLLYRDIDMSSSPASDLTITFRYRTNMSTGFTSTVTRTGWFDKDPLKAPGGGGSNAATGNFISSTDAGNALAPRDSFMVYVGAPVVDSACVYSNGTTARVHDPQRRWFAEVVRANEGLHREVFTVAGDHAPVLTNLVIPNSALQAILAASGGRVRLVYRVKTNRGYDDEGTLYTSGGAGAAVVDDVTYSFGASSSPPGWGDFEAPASIDNSIAVDASTAWKSTGKPPAVYFHTHSLSTLTYEDVCGQPGDAIRACNMTGTVISMGDHDTGEADAGAVEGSAERNRFDGMASPTIQLCGPYPNPIGLQSAADAAATEDYYLDYEIYTGFFDPPSTGNYWYLGAQSYPGNAKAGSGGYPAWGQIRYMSGLRFNSTKECYRDIENNPLKALGAIRTSNASGVPDSIRLIFLKQGRRLYNFPSVSTDGGYLDNFSLAIVDAPTTTRITAIGLNLFQDTFPANGDPSFPGIASKFDTTTAYIKSGANLANNGGPLSIPGDSVVVDVAGASTRVDLVFRILPGPGNYVVVGHPETDNRLRRVPTNPAPVAPGELTNFWSSYLADNGAFGTPGGHPTVGGVKRWDPNVWNSARCDTAETNVFAYQDHGVPGGPPQESWVANWMTTYHESDLRGGPSQLGLSRHKCFVASPVAQGNVTDCVHNPPSAGPGWDLSYVTPAVGYNGQPTTVEGTKILPDGMFTPGTHVEYFFRAENGGSLIGLIPDTTTVYPQIEEASEDGHRWQEFSVLPDRWKETGYIHPVRGTSGLGAACMLVVDLDDGGGSERAWVAAADTSGATQASAFGAHNGWHGSPGSDANDPAGFVARHGGHPGTSWDLYQVRGSSQQVTEYRAGGLGSRYQPTPTDAQLGGKQSRQGPTHEMLAAYYRMMVLLTGDFVIPTLGPVEPLQPRGSNDLAVISTWLTSGSTSEPQRGIWAIGSGLAEMTMWGGPGSSIDIILKDYFGVGLQSPNYWEASSNSDAIPDLLVAAPISPGGDVWGVRNTCRDASDVLVRDPGLASMTTVSSTYENTGGGPYVAGVLKSFAPAKPWIALLDGWDLKDLRSQDGSTTARGEYVGDVLRNVFGAPICSFALPPNAVHPGAQAQDFARLLNNPAYRGHARLQLGLARADRVEVRIYDLAGRVIRTLADRPMPAGVHDLVWDGLDDEGGRVAHGVYFTRVRYRDHGFESARKVTLLR